MFGYSTELRSSTQGKGEFAMEYYCYAPVREEVMDELINEYENARNPVVSKKKSGR